MSPDYSLYLVTDSTQAILGDKHLPTIVEQAIQGGVTVVQLRDKTSETNALVQTARKLLEITRKHGVPLIINDRVDIALAVGADGVHLGQDDLDLPTARSLLGPQAIIGVTASCTDEAVKAVQEGADYLGIGTVFATPTKENTKSIIGPSGVRDILDALASQDRQIPTVCIGGINAGNVQRVLFQSQGRSKALSGVAVVSAIIASPNPKSTAIELRRLISNPPPFATSEGPISTNSGFTTIDGINSASIIDTKALIEAIPPLHQKLVTTKPLCHNMTNLVVQNFAANVAICVGGSPIMSSNGLEAADLASLNGSLVINMGTANPESMRNYILALNAYNNAGNPVLLDPVGAGATAIRRGAVKELLNSGYFSCIKGNSAEIQTVYALTGSNSTSASSSSSQPQAQHGVDSAPSSDLDDASSATIVHALARCHRTTVVMTGKTDYISNGTHTLAVSNGHPFLSSITGSGCSLGTTIAAFLAVSRETPLLAAVAGCVVYGLAAEHATAGTNDAANVRGPGTFIPAFLDALYKRAQDSRTGSFEWISRARVKDVSDLTSKSER